MSSSVLLATSSAAFEQRVRRALGTDYNGELRRWHSEVMFMDALAAVKEIAREAPDVITLGPNVPVDLALEITRAIDVERPEIGVILVADPTPNLWEQALRAGVREVVATDATDNDIRSAFERLLEVAARRRHNLAAEAGIQQTKGKVVTVVAPKGGAGKTALSTNLAAALARQGENRVCLVDLDLQFGDVSYALGLDPEHTIADLMVAPGGVTATTLKVFLTRGRDGLFALCAPSSPASGEEVPEAVVDRVIRLLAEEFTHVILDTSAGLTESTLSAIELSTDLIFLCDLSVSALTSLRKVIDAVDALGIENPQRHFVLNRADSRVGVSIAEAATLVGMTVDVEIPSTRAVPLAMNSGRSVLEDAPRSAVVRAFQEAAELVSEAPERHRGFGRRRDR